MDVIEGALYTPETVPGIEQVEYDSSWEAKRVYICP